MDITVEEWQAELSRLEATCTNAGDGQTSEEIAAVLGMTQRRVRRMLRLGVAAGRVRVNRVARTALDGVLRTVPGYVIVKKRDSAGQANGGRGSAGHGDPAHMRARGNRRPKRSGGNK